MHAAEFPLLSVGQFGLLAAQFPPGGAMAMPSRVRKRMRSASNSAKVARILKNSFPMGSPGVVERPAEGQFHVSFPKPVGDGARIWDGPCQPVEFRHDQRVAFAHGGEGLVEAGSGAGGAGETVIGVDAILGDAQLQERLALGGQILAGRWNSARIR